MFTGRYITRFSGKNRIILPKKLRLNLEGEKEIVITKGFEGELWGFKKTDWEVEAKRRLELSLASSEGRSLRRQFFGNSEYVVLDDQGRFVIPEDLVYYAKLSTQLVILGAGDHFEIWENDLLGGI